MKYLHNLGLFLWLFLSMTLVIRGHGQHNKGGLAWQAAGLALMLGLLYYYNKKKQNLS